MQMTATDIDWFWAIVETTLPHVSDQEAQLTVMQSRVAEMSPDQLIRFGRTFDQIMRDSYSWDLWGAAYVIMGGASDDGFEYFRLWLISRGRTVFEQAAADPDSLAASVPADAVDALDFEMLAYPAREEFVRKTGREPGATEQLQPEMFYPNIAPSGVAFAEDPSELAQRYPRLWARFGQNPLP